MTAVLAARPSYQEFLAAKAELAVASGFEVSPDEVHPNLKPHQADAVRWMVRGGRRALFASFGLGKSVAQLEACRLVLAIELVAWAREGVPVPAHATEEPAAIEGGAS